MRIALAQINPVVGDLRGNAARVLDAVDQLISSTRHTPDLLVTPELSLWGYPPRDLLFSPTHLQLQGLALEDLRQGLAARQSQSAVLVGMADAADDQRHPALFNAIALVRAGDCRVVARKQLLPSYDVFDETRYFRASQDAAQITLCSGGRDWHLGITICEAKEPLETKTLDRQQENHRRSVVLRVRTDALDITGQLSSQRVQKIRIRRRNRENSHRKVIIGASGLQDCFQMPS